MICRVRGYPADPLGAAECGVARDLDRELAEQEVAVGRPLGIRMDHGRAPLVDPFTDQPSQRLEPLVRCDLLVGVLADGRLEPAAVLPDVEDRVAADLRSPGGCSGLADRPGHRRRLGSARYDPRDGPSSLATSRPRKRIEISPSSIVSPGLAVNVEVPPIASLPDRRTVLVHHLGVLSEQPHDCLGVARVVGAENAALASRTAFSIRSSTRRDRHSMFRSLATPPPACRWQPVPVLPRRGST